jgi:cell division protein FtsA
VSSRTRYIGAVEIGTSKIAVLIGELSPGRSVHLIGYAECQSHGVTKGVITNSKMAGDATHSALVQAEQNAGVKVEEVYLAQSGGHLDGFFNSGTVNVSAADNLVGDRDVQSVCDIAMRKDLPAGRSIVHYLRHPFVLDDRMVGPTPHDLNGRRLGVSYWVVHGHEGRISDGIQIITSFNLPVKELVLSSLASGTMMTSAVDRQNGVLVIDIGGGTTDYVLYQHGCPRVAGVVGVGGSHLTNDLALGLRVTEGQAEKIKLRNGRATTLTRDKNDRVWLNGDYSIGDRQFPRQAIETILAARTREIFEVVRKKLGGHYQPDQCIAGVVLAGGTAKLPGLAEAAAAVFEVPAAVGEMRAGVDSSMRDPARATVLGLLHYGLQARPNAEPAVPRRGRGLIRRFFLTPSP